MVGIEVFFPPGEQRILRWGGVGGGDGGKAPPPPKKKKKKVGYGSQSDNYLKSANGSDVSWSRRGVTSHPGV